MDGFGIGERDLQLRAVIKSNLVCGDINKLDELIDNLFNDIQDVLEHFHPSESQEEE